MSTLRFSEKKAKSTLFSEKVDTNKCIGKYVHKIIMIQQQIINIFNIEVKMRTK